MPDALKAAFAKQYDVQREIGRGGFATVYLAHDIRHNRSVAIKVLSEEMATSIAADRFGREIGIAATLTHPHILPLFDSGEVDGRPYYVMPFVEGESLRDRLQREHLLPIREAVDIAGQVAEALTYAHGKGVVHRDIKPDNVMLAGGQALVADFGIARAIDQAGKGLTTEGLAIGTAEYMSPEQAGGQVDGRADVYSLGCVVYEMLSGHPPFQGSSIREIIVRHARDPVPPLSSARPSIPPQLERAVERALAKEPADRYVTASEFAAALSDAIAGTPEQGQTWLRRAAAWLRQRSRLAIGAAAIAGAMLGALVLSMRRAGSSSATADPAAVAILPFRVVGDSASQFLREGMVDLIATKLGTMDGPRPADTRKVLSAWRRTIGSGEDPSPEQARRVAGQVGSGRFVLGTIVATPRALSISARLHGASGAPSIDASVEGPADSLFTLVDHLCVKLLATVAREPGRRLEELTSTSVAAVRAYLAGSAALRRGEAARAIRYFTTALETDSTFALAALGMAASGAWSQQGGQSLALRRGLRAGYALRSRLPRRDQLLFEAYVSPDEPGLNSAARQFDAWQRATEAAPESPEAQYEYGDRLYHTGAQLGMYRADEPARAAFERTLEIDSNFVAPMGHLVEMAARAGERTRTRRALELYTRHEAAPDAGDYVRWRAAVALDDRATLARLRERRADLGQSALNRIIGFGQADGVGLDDVDHAVDELRRRMRDGQPRASLGTPVHPAQTLHSWAMNRGRASAVGEGIAALRAVEPLPAGSSIVYLSADQIPVLDALFWDGARSGADSAAARLERRTLGTPPRESAPRAVYFAELCVATLWRHLDDTRPAGDGRARAMLARLRLGAALTDSAAIHGAGSNLCVAMIEAIVAARGDSALGNAKLIRLDSLLLQVPYQFGVDFGNLVLARLRTGRGDHAGALAAVRRRPYDWDTAPVYLSTFLREEGRLAALVGDTVAALRAYDRYLALRAGAEPAFQASVASVESAARALGRRQ